MRFYLAKNILSDANPGGCARLATPENQRADRDHGGSCQLNETVSSLIPMMSEQTNGQGFWNIKTVDECGKLLMNELVQCSSNCNRLAALITVSCTSEGEKLKYSVAIEKCDMLRDIFKICGEKAKLILELYFGMPFNLGRSMAGIVTPEMNISCTKKEVSIKASDILATDAMDKFWKDEIILHWMWMYSVYNCNIILIVSDDLPLFQMAFSCDTTRRILEETIHPNFEIITSDNAVVKCHKCFLAAHSTVLTRMLQSDMTESSSSRMKVDDMDKSVVAALLQFLYYKDLPTDDLSLIFQLLKVAHKYEIKLLEHATLNFLIQKQNVYFTAEFALDVCSFVRNIPNGNDLRKKMMEIIINENGR